MTHRRRTNAHPPDSEEDPMADMLDYLDWYGDLGFDVIPFDEVDALLLSQLAYLDLAGVVPSPGEERPITVSEAAGRFSTLHPSNAPEDLGPLISPRTVQLLTSMANTGRRFATATLSSYEAVLDTQTHEQFGALTIGLADGSTFVSFRGTDSSLVGWLEDCEMSYKVVPSQVHALAYLEAAAMRTQGPIRVGGHSKGGNLAAYAVSHCAPAVRDRVTDVWCCDSPGFENDVVPLSGVEPIRDLIHLFTPGYSVVGALFDHVVDPVVIRSDGTGIMEHSAMDWQVMRGKLVRGERAGDGTVYVNQAFITLLCSRDLAGRKKLLDDLYAALEEQGITSLDDMLSHGSAGLSATLGSIRSLDDEDRKVMQDFLWSVAGGAVADAVVPAAMQLGTAVSSALADAREGAREGAHQLAIAIRTQGEKTNANANPDTPAKAD
jgi:hypothetical protein